MAGGTDGNIISYDASGDPVAIATGDDGQVLTSAGAGAPPVFEDAAGGGGGLVLIETITISTSTAVVDFLSSFSSTYDAYMLQVSNARPVSDVSVARLRLAVSGSAVTATYKYAADGFLHTGGTSLQYSASDASIRLHDATGTGTGESFNATIWVKGVNDTNNYKGIHWSCVSYNNTPIISSHHGGGTYGAALSAISGCDFFFIGGNVLSGIFSLYGLAKS